MSIFRDFFVKEKPVFTGITRGLGGFGFGASGGGGGPSFSASGGTKITNGLYTIHHFPCPSRTADATDNFQVTGSGTVDVCVIGAGGGGGSGMPGAYSGGGGGAGGVVIKFDQPVTAQSYPIVTGHGSVPQAWFRRWTMDGARFHRIRIYTDGRGYGGGNGPSPNSPQPWYPARVGGSGGGVSAGPGHSGNDPGPANAPGTGASGHPGGNNVESPPAGWGNPGAPAGAASYSGGGGGGARATPWSWQEWW